MPQSPRKSTTTRQTRRHATTPLPFSTAGGVSHPGQSSRHRAISPLAKHQDDRLASAQSSLTGDPSGYTQSPSPLYQYHSLPSGPDALPKPPDLSTSRSPLIFPDAQTSRQPPPRLQVSPPNVVDTGAPSGIWTEPSIGSSRGTLGESSILPETGPPTPATSMLDSSASVALATPSSNEGLSEDAPMTPPVLDVRVLPSNGTKGRTFKQLKSGPPRPPNAWILYRSEKLKAIAAGEKLENLEVILAEQQAELEEQNIGTSGGPAGKERARPQTSSKTTKKVTKGRKKAGERGTESDQTDDRSPPQESTANSNGHITSKAVPQAEISKVISLMWKRETQQERGRFEKMAQLKKVEVSQSSVKSGE